MKTMLLVVSLIATPALAKSPRAVDVPLANAAGENIGTAKIVEKGKDVEIELDVAKLSPGEHGIHFHEKGLCEAPDFKSAGSHFASDAKQHHGTKNPQGPHSGDLDNFKVGDDGTAKVTLHSKRVSLGKGKVSVLGKALVIHAKADDYQSQPAGDSGDRVACGVIAP